MSTIDDLNYPEKTDTYYIVNAPYIFSACWKVGKHISLHFASCLNAGKWECWMHFSRALADLCCFAGSKTSSAGKNQEESSGAAWHWKGWTIKGKLRFFQVVVSTLKIFSTTNLSISASKWSWSNCEFGQYNFLLDSEFPMFEIRSIVLVFTPFNLKKVVVIKLADNGLCISPTFL